MVIREMLKIFKTKGERELHPGKIEDISIKEGIVKIVIDSKSFNLAPVNFTSCEYLYRINKGDKIFYTIEDNRIKKIYTKEKGLLLYKEHIGV